MLDVKIAHASDLIRCISGASALLSHVISLIYFFETGLHDSIR